MNFATHSGATDTLRKKNLIRRTAITEVATGVRPRRIGEESLHTLIYSEGDDVSTCPPATLMEPGKLTMTV